MPPLQRLEAERPEQSKHTFLLTWLPPEGHEDLRVTSVVCTEASFAPHDLRPTNSPQGGAGSRLGTAEGHHQFVSRHL